MKATIENLKKALKACAKAHNCDFEDYSDEGQLLVCSETPGTICDVHLILDAFYGNHKDAENNGWGSVTVWLSDPVMDSRTKDVDMMTLALALPYGTKL